MKRSQRLFGPLGAALLVGSVGIGLLGAIPAPAAAGTDGAQAIDPTRIGPPAGASRIESRAAARQAEPTAEVRRSWPARVDATLVSLASAQPIRSAAAHDDDAIERGGDLQAKLREIADAVERRASIGVAVKDLASGRELFVHHPERALNPASNHKLVTAIAAVELLGADYRFATRVLVHDDALYIVGEGDPSLQVQDVSGLVAATLAAIDPASIRRIVVDERFFSAARQAPGYDDAGPGFSYLAPSGALSLQFNTIEIAVRPGGVGLAPVVTVTPECSHVRVVNHATTGRRGSVAVRTSEDGDATRVTVSGRIGTKARPVRIRRRITDPALFFGSVFADRFAALGDGIVRTVERGETPPDAVLVSQHESAPLSEVLASALSYSNNFTTEQVLRTLGARASGAPGDWDNGADAVRRFWIAIGRSPDELSFVNASGYGHAGRINADALVDLIALTQRAGSPAAALVPALAAPGEHGTLRGRLSRARGHVRAKTGTLRGASALTGIVSTDDGRRYGFSILVNGPVPATTSRRVQDRIVTAVFDHVRTPLKYAAANRASR